MAGVNDGFGLDSLSGQLTAATTALAIIAEQIAAFQQQVAALTTLAANLQTGNYYTKTEVDAQHTPISVAIAGLQSALTSIVLPTYSEAIRAFLASADSDAARSALGLGTAATASADAFASASGDVEERARDAIAAALRFQIGLLHNGSGGTWSGGNGAWQFRVGGSVVATGTSAPPAIGWSVTNDDTPNLIILRHATAYAEGDGSGGFDAGGGGGGGAP
jgi:hypothetical protein